MWTLVENKPLNWFPYEREDNSTGFARISFACHRFALSHAKSLTLTVITFSNKSGRTWKVDNGSGQVKSFGPGGFPAYAEERFGKELARTIIAESLATDMEWQLAKKRADKAR